MNAVRLLVLALLLAVPASAGACSSSGLAEGVVVKLGTNDPIPGADRTHDADGRASGSYRSRTAEHAGAICHSESSIHGNFGADGKFTFRNIAAGNYNSLQRESVEVLHLWNLDSAEPLAAEWYSRSRMENRKRTSVWKWRLWVRLRTHSGCRQQTGWTRCSNGICSFYRNGERIVTMLELVHSDDHGESAFFADTGPLLHRSPAERLDAAFRTAWLLSPRKNAGVGPRRVPSRDQAHSSDG